MRKGAEAAAKALGADLVFQGAPEFNAVQQVPVLDAVIARHPDAILIAPTDRTQLVQPLEKAADAGIPVVTVDTFIGSGVCGTGSGDADFRSVPSRPTTCPVAAWRPPRGTRWRGSTWTSTASTHPWAASPAGSGRRWRSTGPPDWNARVILMEEPTAALGVPEQRRVLALIRTLEAQDRAVVFVSRNLQEIFAVADRIVVLRRGSLAGERRVADTRRDEVVKPMIGG